MRTLNNQPKQSKISFNAPVTLTFVIVCFVALILSDLTNGFTNDLLFSVYRSSLLSPFTYIRFFGHAIGHADWSHLMGNMMIILILGPLLEEKYGSANLLFVMIVTAFVTGLASFILFPNVYLLGASGIVFALILLSSFTSLKEGTIPLTFILVAILYIGEQIYQGIYIDDSVSNSTHIIGGICGAILGYYLNKNKIIRTQNNPFTSVNQDMNQSVNQSMFNNNNAYYGNNSNNYYGNNNDGNNYYANNTNGNNYYGNNSDSNNYYGNNNNSNNYYGNNNNNYY